MKSRKLIGMIIGLALLTIVLIVIAILVPEAINGAVIVFYMTLIVFLITAYIGGNVFSAWVKSKYFRQELNE